MRPETPQVTPERFAQGFTFSDYIAYAASAENLRREGTGGGSRHTLGDMSRAMAGWYATTPLSEWQADAMRRLAEHPDGPARVLVVSEEWSSDCRRDVPVFQRLAEAGALELRIFTRDGQRYGATPEPEDSPNADLMRQFLNRKPGGPYQSIPIAAFFDARWRYLYHYTEFPALYHKDTIQARLRARRPGESEGEAGQRYQRDWLALRESPFFRVWASACADEIISELHRRLLPG
ncbi:MAG: hypothetical protein FJZ92_04570 [Chloroflexi bacterium]|nr:hypothetical protein [Chloroflexota bacterium]